MKFCEANETACVWVQLYFPTAQNKWRKNTAAYDVWGYSHSIFHTGEAYNGNRTSLINLKDQHQRWQYQIRYIVCTPKQTKTLDQLLESPVWNKYEVVLWGFIGALSAGEKTDILNYSSSTCEAEHTGSVPIDSGSSNLPLRYDIPL